VALERKHRGLGRAVELVVEPFAFLETALGDSVADVEEKLLEGERLRARLPGVELVGVVEGLHVRGESDDVVRRDRRHERQPRVFQTLPVEHRARTGGLALQDSVVIDSFP